MTLTRSPNLTRGQRATLRAELEREHARLGASGHGGELASAVADALQRMDEGRYGVCLLCSGPIPFARLTVLPETQHCLNCGRR